MTVAVPDVFGRTAELVDIPSESRDEAAITEHLAGLLGEVPGLELTRVGDNLVARTELDRSERVILAGHTDTVPANDNARARVEGDGLWGLGAADMKAGLAVMVELALAVPEPDVNVTYVFYAREEIAAAESGLEELFVERPDLLAGDLAVLGEPTSAEVEAGCQGTLRLAVRLAGERAHSARPWMGRNAIHRAAPLLAAVAGFSERRPVIEGCEFREALQAVAVDGGVAANVVPDGCEIVLNHRFAPDRSADEAEASVRDLLAPHLDDGDEVERIDVADAAYPGVGHPRLAAVIDRHDLAVSAKLGWTDVARFSARGTPAVNLGPGDATLAHAADERVDRAAIERTYAVLHDLITAS